MTNPNWLDEARRYSAVYAVTVHHACVCEWELDHDEAGPMWRLKTRKSNCVIHGKNGSH